MALSLGLERPSDLDADVALARLLHRERRGFCAERGEVLGCHLLIEFHGQQIDFRLVDLGFLPIREAG